MADLLETLLLESRTRVEIALERHLPASELDPATLHAAMRYAVFAGGKRIRPALVFGAAGLAATPGSDALVDDAAVAIELVHTYSLVHDDLPAMDDDALRRGKPTCHVVYGEANAILVGDALLTLAFRVLAGDRDDGRAQTRVHAMRTLADAAGSVGMAGGQALDLGAERGSGTAPLLLDIQRRKTGALMGCAAALGAIVGGLDASAVDRLTRFGVALGTAFQIADDILDVEASSSQLGKTPGKDARAGKLTYPAMFGVVASRTEARRQIQDAVALLLPHGDLAQPLRMLAHHVIARRS